LASRNNSNDLEDAFLWNMIALEILLTNSDDRKFLDILPKRIEAFFGWYTNWKTDEFEKKIGEIYGKRCCLVHRAKGEDITTEDLLFTDSLLFNLLLNITSFPKIFCTQNNLIDFSRKLEAQKVLGIRRKPMGLKFVKVDRDNADVKKFFGK
jgi:Apea-like HEPN